MPWSFIIPAAASLIGGAMSSGAMSDAANTAANAQNQAAQLQYQMWQQNSANAQPWLNTGNLALSQLATYLGLASPQDNAARSRAIDQVAAGWGLDPSAVASNPAAMAEVQRLSSSYGQPAGGGAPAAAPSAAPGYSLSLPTNALGPAAVGVLTDASGNLLPGVADAYASSGAGIGLSSQPWITATQAGAGAGAMPRQTGMGMVGSGAGAGSNALAGFGGNPNDPNFGMLTRQFNPSQLASDPGYQFQLQQGLDTIKNQASALGGVNSGGTLKSLANYAQGLASTDYNTAFSQWQSRLNNIYSMLAGVSGTGANSALKMAGIGTNVAGTAGDFTAGAGQTLGAGQLGSANALSSGITNAGNSLQQMFQNMGQGTTGVPSNPFYTDAGVGTITGADASMFW